MIFDTEDISFKIITVTRVRRHRQTIRTVDKNTSAISCRLEGSGWFSEDGKITEYRKDDIAFAPAGSTYTQYSENEELIFINLDIDNYDGREIEIFSPENATLGKLFEEICTVWNFKQVGYYYRVQSLLSELFYRIAVSRRARSGEAYSRIEASVDFMRANIFDPSLTISKIAECSRVSEVYFRKLFSAEFGVPPLKYINDLRLKHAKTLLLCGDFSIGEVAERSGFASYQYFYECFKKHEGRSPSEYAIDIRML